jgi:adenylate kinase
MSRIFLFMGIQGAGKGTQAARLAEALHIPQISTGNIFRAVIKQESPLGEELRGILNAGLLVPDELTSKMVKDRIAQPDAQQGFILDGYPRTQIQSGHLDAMLAERNTGIERVFFFDLPDEEAVARLEPRRVCSVNESHIYHLVHNPPKQPGICDVDGAPLKQRDDDKPEAIKKRVSEYLDQTMPLIAIYEKRGLVSKIDAIRGIDNVTQEMMQLVNNSTVK